MCKIARFRGSGSGKYIVMSIASRVVCGQNGFLWLKKFIFIHSRLDLSSFTEVLSSRSIQLANRWI